MTLQTKRLKSIGDVRIERFFDQQNPLLLLAPERQVQALVQIELPNLVPSLLANQVVRNMDQVLSERMDLFFTLSLLVSNAIDEDLIQLYIQNQTFREFVVKQSFVNSNDITTRRLRQIAMDPDFWLRAMQTQKPSDLQLILEKSTDQSTLVQATQGLQVGLPVVSLDTYLQLTEQSMKYFDSMDPLSKEALLIQTSLGSNESQKINEFLRTGQQTSWSQPRSIPEVVHDLDSLICNSTVRLNESVYVQRGISQEDPVEMNLLEDPGYKSTSLNPRVALRFCRRKGPQCILLQIELPAGYPIIQVQAESRFSESEIVLSRGTRFTQVNSLNIFAQDQVIQLIRLRALQSCT